MVEHMKVEDVMTPTVVVVGEDTPFKEVVTVMHEHRVSGVPVLNADKKLVGIVTEADLLAIEEEQLEPRPRGRSFLEWFIHPARMVELERQAEDLRAQDIMTPSVVTTTPETEIPLAAKTMLDAAVKRLPVVDPEGHVLGIVSRADLLLPYLRPDEEIAREITEDVIFRTMWLDPLTIAVKVHEGVVTIRGTVERKSVKEILLELVRRVDGVVGVEEQLSYEMDDREAHPVGAYSDLGWGENWARRPN